MLRTTFGIPVFTHRETTGVDFPQVAYLAIAHLVKTLRGFRTHAPQALDGKMLEERELAALGHDHEPIGFFEIGSDLGEKLVGGDADRRF